MRTQDSEVVMADLHLIEMFLLLSSERSFTRVAEKLGTTQPSVSIKLRKLEEELGFELFIRTSRKVTLTPEGLEFLAAAQKVRNAATEADLLASSLRDRRQTRLRLGAPLFSALVRDRIDLLDCFMRDHPLVVPEIYTAPTDEVLARLREGELDMIFATLPVGTTSDLEICPVSRATGHIALPPGHPLAGTESVSRSDLESQQVVVFPRQIGRRRFEAWYGLLFEAGAEIVEAPEAAWSALLRFAKARKLPIFAFVWPGDRRASDFFTWRPIAPAAYVDMVLVRLLNPVARTSTSELFWEHCVRRGRELAPPRN